MGWDLINFFLLCFDPALFVPVELLKFILCVLGIIALYKYIKHH